MHLSQILPSVFASIGLSSAQDFLGCGESPSGREVLFLIDGLGADAIKSYRDQIPVLAAAIDKGVVTTSFPTTTATSLATLTTGAMPGAHGMLGYTVRVPRSGGRVLNTLKWDERVDPQVWQPIPSLFEHAMAAGITTTHVRRRDMKVLDLLAQYFVAPITRAPISLLI